MIRLALSIAALESILAGQVFAEMATPKLMGQPFYNEKLQVEWKAPTNALPSTVAIFKVMPTSFSPAVISNVVGLTSFTSSNRIRSFDSEEKIPEGTLVFQSQDEKSSLGIVPPFGWIFLYAPDQYYPKFDFEGVPDEARAYELGTNILRQLELPPGEVQLREDHQPRVTFAAGTLTHQRVSHRDMMRVEFGRRLDNIDCFIRRLEIEFGAHERVARLELYWPKVQAEKRYPTATGDQIIKWIKEGRSRAQDLEGPMEARVVEPKEIKRLTVTGINLYYSDVISRSEFGEEKTVDRLYPYAILGAEAEFGPGDTETITLFCPMTPEWFPASHESRPFSIYPSKQYERLRRAPMAPGPQ
jgi:hypothetical protein